MLTKKDLNILNTTKHKTLIKWWEELNTWKWPQDLPGEEKPIYKNVRKTRRGVIMDWIKNKVGLRNILRTHNAYMTDKEFRDFWNGTQGKSKKAFRRYIKRIRNPKYIEKSRRAYLRRPNKSLNTD